MQDLYRERAPLVSRLADLLRGSAQTPDAGKHIISHEEALAEAGRLLDGLLAQYPDAYPMLVERHGIRFYLEPNSLFGSGPDQITVMIWGGTRWCPLAELPCDPVALAGSTGAASAGSRAEQESP